MEHFVRYVLGSFDRFLHSLVHILKCSLIIFPETMNTSNMKTPHFPNILNLFQTLSREYLKNVEMLL